MCVVDGSLPMIKGLKVSRTTERALSSTRPPIDAVTLKERVAGQATIKAGHRPSSG